MRVNPGIKIGVNGKQTSYTAALRTNFTSDLVNSDVKFIQKHANGVAYSLA